MKIDILTLFPEMFAPLEHSIVGKAKEKGLLDIHYHNFRDYAEKARHVDDEPYGGGQGMLLRAQPIFDTIEQIEAKKPRIILLDPAGKPFTQAYAEELALEEELIFICGHYEGYDERIKTLVTDEISLGDFVLTGGELAAMTMVDATVRLIPQVLGKESSHQDDSFSSGLLEYPQYTRPYDYRGMTVPDVLMSGHHERIRLWRLEESLRKTYLRRPDLLEHYNFSEEERKLLDKIEERKLLDKIKEALGQGED
ncbi:TPA: tRNA (guanosine(37)-N1)-methyltransferase TrmD [Streptococcus pyogenes]|uniref:tRNA (guanosine(37)-N1)-methyltransferase TrmD n=1 Tax=Streptococcus pyogenes TaxID=1314 RepID=UPI002B3B6B54|nr:tRNA (guanosine(37)-N1)-methyltransferase TrmD [Streptococcus pyogenes]HER4667873.1 tRNA (guanosine(37)-N1)-methyltransferase TrmD [Streptococcus pyogenes NGAS401]HER4761534.1 tRNA (guanosine(37)-N1)-methyltransferase TrmD [Streptococcus pyogenes NGAS227]HEQ1052988.1 tRNA (guanosine(37)-N1)-methyltransferase TrmD [Streptococcus pyogenes]HEQ1054968.1 tRNA (guanosine(37)-N1)-methyltransferase TrmD [Streptococcus pyogenes]